jgi:hypothetical protein
LAGANILSTPIFVTFSALRAGTISSAGEIPPIKAGPPATTTHLLTARGEINIFREKKENISKVWEKSAAADYAGPNSKEMLPRMRQHLLIPRFCQRQYFVDANILSARIFCWREYLSTRTFCRCEHFVDANILLTPMFCRRHYFAAANSLSPPIVCRRQYFVAANILSVFRF